MLVTHGISFLPQVDQIIVLQDGRISEVSDCHLLAQKFIGLINPFAPELPLNTWHMPVHIPCNASDKPRFKDKFVILLVQGKEIFPAAMGSKMNTIQSRMLEKKAKKTCRVDPKILLKILFHYLLQHSHAP